MARLDAPNPHQESTNVSLTMQGTDGTLLASNTLENEKHELKATANASKPRNLTPVKFVDLFRYVPVDLFYLLSCN